jgi:release factor glutamine methyltransferase
VAARRLTAARLADAGFIWADDEAEQLVAASGGDPDRLERLLARRLEGEPLAWITGRVAFCGISLRIDPGVYVPRPHSEPLAERAAELAGEEPALDVCTGCGAIAAVLASRSRARVLAGDIDERAVACARRNGIDALLGDLFRAFPDEVAGSAGVVTAVVPYVPRTELPLLQRDTFAFETPAAYDGGVDGLDLVRRVVVEARRWLRPGGALLVEIGDGQAAPVTRLLNDGGYSDARPVADEDGEVRALEAVAQ